MEWYVIDKDGVSCLVILKYISKISKVETSLFDLIKLLIAL